MAKLGDMSDYEQWDTKACRDFATDLVGEVGVRYAEFYSKLKKTKSKSAKAMYQANLNTLTRFLNGRLAGYVIDPDTFISGIKYRVDHGYPYEYKRHGGDC